MIIKDNKTANYFFVARRGAHLAAERSPSAARAVERGGAQRCQMARAWPRAAQRKSIAFLTERKTAINT